MLLLLNIQFAVPVPMPATPLSRFANASFFVRVPDSR